MKYLLITVSLFLSLSPKAQTQFIPVEIELTSGTVEKGFIEKQNLSKTPKTFTVYSQQNRNNSKIYSPAEVKRFTITNFGSYIGITISRYIHELNPQRLNAVSQEEAILSEPVFLLLLVKGNKLNLYSHNFNGRYNFFIQEGDGDIKALRYLRTINTESSSIAKVSDYRYYMQQLLPYVSGNDDLVDKLEMLDWKESQMIKFVKYINTNSVAYAPYKGPKQEPSSTFFIGAGANISFRKFTVKFAFENSLDKIEFPASISPVLSAGYELPLGAQSSRFAFQPVFTFFYFQSKGTNNFKDATGANATSKYYISGFSIFPGAALKYQIGSKIKAGVGANLHLDILTESLFVTNAPADQILNKSPIWFNAFVQADYLFSDHHSVTVAFSPMQKILEGQQDVWLKSGYGFVTYTYRFGKKE
jgi:hypothetical protein